MELVRINFIIFGFLLCLGLIVLLLIGLGIVFAATRTGRRTASTLPAAPAAETPLDILNRRYAAGELSREQYEQMKRDLEG